MPNDPCADHLLSLSRWRDAVSVFELVLELAPAEPHSHIDLALTTLQWVRAATELAPSEVEAAFRSVVQLLVMLPLWQTRDGDCTKELSARPAALACALLPFHLSAGFTISDESNGKLR